MGSKQGSKSHFFYTRRQKCWKNITVCALPTQEQGNTYLEELLHFET